jgi:signal transduction histidine kinase
LLTVINEESDRLNRLVGEAAEIAQLGSGQLELHLEPHHIREAIDSAIRESRQALQWSNATPRGPGRKSAIQMKKTLDVFQAYDWPGNIRELQNVVERAVILCDGKTVLGRRDMAAAKIEPTVRPTGFSVEVNIPENLPLVRMDLIRLTEVIVHLRENAGKYSPP